MQEETLRRSPQTPENQESWTVIKLLNWSTTYLEEKGVENARLNVERLLAHVLDCNRIELYLKFDRPLNPQELAAYRPLLLRRARREPLQYILGETEFYSRALHVQPGVLIPRPETEIVVELAIERAKRLGRPARILDGGVGSGNISVALACELPDAQLVGVDLSEMAIEVAASNARRHGVDDRIELVRCNLLSQDGRYNLGSRRFDLFVSNPPYIATTAAATLAPEVRDHEPAEALFADDPLQFYQSLLSLATRVLQPGGALICEIGEGLEQQVPAAFVDAGFEAVEVTPDLAGRARVVSGTFTLKQEENPRD